MRKRLLVLAVGAPALSIIVTAAPPLQEQLRLRRERIARSQLIDAAHRDRIMKGMPKDEVAAILGGPPGDFSSRAKVYRNDVQLGLKMPHYECWYGDQGEIKVAFDSEGKVAGVWPFDEGIPLPPTSLAERMRGWLQRLSP
jgi:hypothetical protein